MSYTDRIFPTNKGLSTYLDELLGKNYQIPTFQREVVWEKENVKKLWDSIYKFYPLGSILIWKTDIKLQNHRHIGGHQIDDPSYNRTEYQYILDGQQRTTSLITSLYGGAIENKPGFDPTIYVDLTIERENETDDDSYKNQFLFWDEIDDKGGSVKQNISKKKKYEEGLIVKLYDIKHHFGTLEGRLVKYPEHLYEDYEAPVRVELRRIRDILDNYRISFIEVKGIQVAEVCQIFERINQAGKPLGIFDIVVAKTFRPEEDNIDGFYLRDLIDDFRKINNSEFLTISDLDFLQMIAILINQNVKNSGVYNITDRYLNEIKTEYIEEVWAEGKKAILKTFDFFENHLHIKTPYLIPFRYYYLTFTNYFYKNDRPDYDFLAKYFWYHSFHDEDLLSNTTQLFKHIDFMNQAKVNQSFQFDRFLIDRNKLRSASYSSRGRLSRATIALYANVQPKDWNQCDRDVIVQNYYFSTDNPNLHHVFPLNSEYILNHPRAESIHSNSLMNIVYLTQLTNLKISNRNPLEYFKDYDSNKFKKIMPSHLLPDEVLGWATHASMDEDALDIFIEKRVSLIIENLRNKLTDIRIDVVDTRSNA